MQAEVFVPVGSPLVVLVPLEVPRICKPSGGRGFRPPRPWEEKLTAPLWVPLFAPSWNIRAGMLSCSPSTHTVGSQ